jgi:hypothetical protein
MSTETFQPERGDDRQQEVADERRFERDDATVVTEYGRGFESDSPGVALGEFALIGIRGNTLHPRRLGKEVGLRRAHIRIHHAGISPPV